MVAVRCNLVLARADRLDSIDPHQSSDPALANIEPHLLQLHRHPRTTIAAKAEAVLFPDMGQHFHVRPLPPTDRSRAPGTIAALTDKHDTAKRSEEHTSELQSLMRITYAVFCLKKKKEQCK